MESNQLKNIQNIENSLSLLKLKIQHMAKIENHNENALHHIIERAVPIVQKKMKERKQVNKQQLKKSQSINYLNHIRKKNHQSRIINERQVIRSKELVSMMKQHNSLHLKQSTKKNQEKVKKIKQITLEEKRQKRLLIKQKEKESQMKIHQFYNHKQQQLKMKRQREIQENEERIRELAWKMKELNDKENEMQQKVRHSNSHISRFKNIIKKVENMKLEDFQSFKGQIKGDCKGKDSKQIVQRILVYSAQNSI